MKHWLYSLVLLFLFSCPGEKFSSKSQGGSLGGDPIVTHSVSTCASRTLQKPPVDLLYLVDNSSSVNFLNESLRDSIASSMAQLSEEFDYRAMVAPLIEEPGETGLTGFLKFASTPISSSVIGTVYNANDLASVYQPFTTLVGGSLEHGIKRSIDIINANMHSQVQHSFFRKGAYTHIVIISNGDDNEAVYTSEGYLDPAATNALVAQRLQSLKTFTRKHYDDYPSSSLLRSEEFRFFTVVPHSDCATGYKKGARYMDFSRQIYNYVTGSSVPPGSIADSVDICAGNFTNLLAQITANIQAVIVPHTYNWWPVGKTNNFNKASITVSKSGGYTCTRDDLANGFRYDDQYRVNQETRESPAPPAGTLAEPYTGYLVELFGNCKVTYPECALITVQDPTVFRGYLVFQLKPKKETLTITKNGVALSESMTNGWELLPGTFSGNVYIFAPDDFTTQPPEQSYEQGFAVKFHGPATPSTFDVLTWSYDPDSI